jgi:hypothetical protein
MQKKAKTKSTMWGSVWLTLRRSVKNQKPFACFLLFIISFRYLRFERFNFPLYFSFKCSLKTSVPVIRKCYPVSCCGFCASTFPCLISFVLRTFLWEKLKRNVIIDSVCGEREQKKGYTWFGEISTVTSQLNIAFTSHIYEFVHIHPQIISESFVDFKKENG